MRSTVSVRAWRMLLGAALWSAGCVPLHVQTGALEGCRAWASTTSGRLGLRCPVDPAADRPLAALQGLAGPGLPGIHAREWCADSTRGLEAWEGGFELLSLSRRARSVRAVVRLGDGPAPIRFLMRRGAEGGGPDGCWTSLHLRQSTPMGWPRSASRAELTLLLRKVASSGPHPWEEAP